MKVYKIKNTPSENQYHGCGKAWAAIKDGVPLAIKYMGDFAFNPESLPAWVQAVLKESSAVGDSHFSIKYFSGFELGKIKQAAIAAGHPEFGPRGGQIQASSIARKARHIISDSERDQFGQYRIACRSELEAIGDMVVSGMCSCYEFVTKDDVFNPRQENLNEMVLEPQ